jgi:hypothetical protein
VRHLKVDHGLSKDDIFALIDAFRTINPDDTSALDFETFQGRLGTAGGGQSVLFPEMDTMKPLLERLRTFDDSATATAPPSSTAAVAPAGVGSGNPGTTGSTRTKGGTTSTTTAGTSRSGDSGSAADAAAQCR